MCLRVKNQVKVPFVGGPIDGDNLYPDLTKREPKEFWYYGHHTYSLETFEIENDCYYLYRHEQLNNSQVMRRLVENYSAKK